MFLTSMLALGGVLSFRLLAQAAIIPVRSAADFAFSIGPVVYELQNDITRDTIIFAKVGGVRITSAPGQVFTISGNTPDKNLLLFEGSHDIQIDHIKVQRVLSSKDNPRINAIHILESSNVPITDTSVFGRITGDRIDGMTVQFCDITSNYTVNGINIWNSGSAVKLANIVIQNNHIHETSSGMLVKAIGARVINNVISGFVSTAVQVDMGVHNICDSGWVTVESNYIVRPAAGPPAGDRLGIYLDTHWAPLIYLDFTTSNIVVENNVVMNVARFAAAKVNTGHLNRVVENVAINAGHLGNVGCENGGQCDRNNCGTPLGQFWLQRGLVQTDYMTAIPWFASLCSDKKFNGIDCTTTAEADRAFGGCSGVPHGNMFKWIVSGDMGKFTTQVTLPAPSQQGIVCGAVAANNADLLNSFTYGTFSGDVLSSPPSLNSMPILSQAFVSKYPAFAQFNANLGSSGQSPASLSNNTVDTVTQALTPTFAPTPTPTPTPDSKGGTNSKAIASSNGETGLLEEACLN